MPKGTHGLKILGHWEAPAHWDNGWPSLWCTSTHEGVNTGFFVGQISGPGMHVTCSPALKRHAATTHDRAAHLHLQGQEGGLHEVGRQIG